MDTVRVAIVALFVAIGGLLLPGSAAAQDVVPARNQVLILVRALAYERNLPAKAGESVTVLVVYKDGDAVSRARADEVHAAISALSEAKVGGVPLRGAIAAFGGAANLTGIIGPQGIDAVYIAPGLQAAVGEVVSVTRAAKVLSMASERGYLADGAAMGVFLAGTEPKLVVNLEACKGEGAAFSAELLRLVEVVR